MQASGGGNFETGEKILAYHQSLIYEAKVLKKELRPDNDKNRLGARKPFYFIHYQGWKERWDEWVDETRMLKYNDENKALRKKLNEEMRSTKKKRGWPKGKKRKASEMDKKTNFQLDIPLGLRKRLVKDHGFIRDKSLVPLPRTPNVADILKAYVAELKPLQFSDMTETADSTEKNQEAGSSTDSNTFDEVVEGVRLYFDKALGSLLLYRFERMQFSEVFKKNKNVPPSELYGAEHLLRLFVKLPELLDGVEMEDDAKKLLAQKLNDILSYLDRNRKSLFLPEYEAATPSYRRMVE